MAYLGEIVAVEADEIALFELVYIAYLLPVVNLRIARGGKPSSVASRLLQAVVYQSAAIEALGAGVAQYVLAPQLAPCHLYHLAYVGLGLLLRRLFGAFLGLGRIKHIIGLFPRQAVRAEPVSALEVLHGGLCLVAVVAGGLSHVSHIHQLLLHLGYVLALHAFLYAILGRTVAHEYRQRLFSRPAVHIQLYAKGLGEAHLPLEQLHAVLCGGAEEVRRRIRIHIAQLHQPLLKRYHPLAGYASVQYGLGRGQWLRRGRWGWGGLHVQYAGYAAFGLLYGIGHPCLILA